MNININKDDPNINEFLFAWEKFKKQPSKYVLNLALDPELFLVWIKESECILKSSYSDYFPSKEEESVLNEKRLFEVRISEKEFYYITFTHFDVMTDESIINDISIYYLSENEDYIKSKIIPTIVEMELDLDDEDLGDVETKSKVYILSQNNGALDAELLELEKKDFDDIDLYYNDNVIKKTNKMLKHFNKSKKGIGIIYGPRGCGKTNLINYIISNSKKNVVIIPICFVDFIINPEFRNIVKKLPNTLFVIDDSEVFISDMNAKSNIYISNLVQLVDGIQSDTYPVNILCVSNMEHIDEIDMNLLECNNLLACIECGPLENKKAKVICETLNKKFKFEDGGVILSHVLNSKKMFTDKKELGF